MMRLRICMVAGLVAAATWYTYSKLHFEEDPVQSLASRDAVEDSLFDRFHAASPFQGKLFVELDGSSDSQRQEIEEVIAEAGYRPLRPTTAAPLAEQLLKLAPAILPQADIEQALSAQAVAARARELVFLVSLPGAAGAVEGVQQDPLGLARQVGEAGTRLFRSREAADQPSPRVFLSPATLSYEKIERVYRRLLESAQPVRAISGDFFALANYQAVRRDIFVCSVISLPLNALLFWIFVRRWKFLGFLFVGSLVSYVAGLLALAALQSSVLTLVLVFTSTFVSFNNEYLVHLCGLDPTRASVNRLSLGSAIGTTFLGFAALLFADAVIVRQIALVSIGGMLGFLSFLLVFSDVLATIHLRPWRWQMWSVRARPLLAIALALIAGVLLVGMPGLRTRVDTFGVTNQRLREQADYFGQRASQVAGATILAIEAGDDPAGTWQAAGTAAGERLVPHPLALWRPLSQQMAHVQRLNAGYTTAVESLRQHLADGGIRLTLPPPPTFMTVSAQSFLRLSADLWPAPTWLEEGGHPWLILGLRGAEADQATQLFAALGRRIVVLTPRAHYDALLTQMSRQILGLFAAGLLAMALYLVVLHRSWQRLLYILLPLGVAFTALLALLRWSGTYEVNLIHLTGFALVIALAIDYSSIAVSSGFGELERTKVLITGLSTLASFGTLVLARHPVLRDLGITVALGCVVSLAFALFLRLQEEP